MLNVIESGGITKDELRANVLIVDLGSSTTDLTLVTGGTTEAPIDFGLEVGAALIDKQILEHNIGVHPRREELRQALAGDQTARERCEFLCRRVKEEYFSNENLYRASGRAVRVDMETVEGISFFPSVNASLMQEILSAPLPALGQKSWTDAFRALLVEANDRLAAQDCTPSAVVATGGASRMSFVQRLCESVFPDSKFRRDEEPEASIARGLALWGRVYLRTADFEAAVSEVADRQIPEIVTRRSDDLIQQIAPAAAQALIDGAIRPALLAWRSGEIATVAEIEPLVQARAKEWLEGSEFNAVVADAVEAWSGPLRTELNDLTDPVCARYGIPRGSLNINPALRSARDSALNASEPACGAISEAVIDAVVMGLLAVTVAMLFIAGPGGWIGGLIGSFLGLTKAEEIRKTNIWKSLRPTILSDARISTCLEQMKPNLAKALGDELKSGPGLAEMSAQISAELKALLLDRADEARLLIR